MKRVRRRKKRANASSRYYLLYKESARRFVYERLKALNVEGTFAYNRIAIRDQKSRWGSCSAKGNLNFNYRIMFLPEHLADYIIVHELCHLKEFNHSASFWKLVQERMPEYRTYRDQLQKIDMRQALHEADKKKAA